MAGLQVVKMHLTDDDVHNVVARRNQSIDVRIRVWRHRKNRPVVLVEAVDPGRPIKPWACHIAAHVTSAVTKGDTAFAYLERTTDGRREAFYLVHFLVHRLAYVIEPWREPQTRLDVEFVIGQSV